MEKKRIAKPKKVLQKSALNFSSDPLHSGKLPRTVVRLQIV
jgi:hypothetical protein